MPDQARLWDDGFSDYVNSRKKKHANTGTGNLGIFPNCIKEGFMVNYPCVEAYTWCTGPNLALCGHDMQRLRDLNRRRCFLLSGVFEGSGAFGELCFSEHQILCQTKNLTLNLVRCGTLFYPMKYGKSSVLLGILFNKNEIQSATIIWYHLSKHLLKVKPPL